MIARGQPRGRLPNAHSPLELRQAIGSDQGRPGPQAAAPLHSQRSMNPWDLTIKADRQAPTGVSVVVAPARLAAASTSADRISSRVEDSSYSYSSSSSAISVSTTDDSYGRQIRDTNSDSTSASSSSLTASQPAIADRKARKKDQNRRAAYNYRRKKMDEKNRMREEEMRLVYSRVCLIGYAERLEGSIMYILSSKVQKILDKDGNAAHFLCPICLLAHDNILKLRNHLNNEHVSEYNII